LPVVTVSHLRKQYGDQVAVKDVSFTVDEGEIFGIVGPNGAGKTTTVECVVGLRVPDGGSVSVFGLDPQTDGKQLRQRLGMQLQHSAMPEKLRVAEALDLYASFYENPADWQELLRELGLEEKRNSPYSKLSGGQQQRLSIALALVGNPRVAILDELTTGLDPVARRDTWSLIERIRDRGVTVILVTHFMEEAERLCNRVAIIDSGQIVALDTPAGLVASISPGQRMRFRPTGDVDDALLTALDEVTDVTRHGNEVTVTGTGNLVHVVTSALAAVDVIATDLRVEQPTLDDAFVALTGRRVDD
jgi:ABC-2 type transport system ATP-binding protein